MRRWVATTVIIAAVAACTERAREANRRARGDTITATAAHAAPPAHPIDEAALRAAIVASDARLAAIDSLKRRFVFQRDSVYGGGWYTPRGQVGAARTMLRCLVTTSGDLQFASVYIGDSWVFHEQAVVRVGEDILETDRVPLYDDDNDRAAGSVVVEQVNYRNGRDRGVIRGIADADSARILVRLLGRQRHHDFTLPDRARREIRDCLRLSDLLKGQ